ncbi:lysoplasmalogenase-like protein TMEM86A [Physella acuta]|uniref:lysoplasmalogenase-like protein TMEM86A n=1 Tax=Physella acuta TaxID=109671 RepID=UPI0027DC7EE1|nr:lysoplasmalogenase-like protein TMEM86A [Physella acuta]
MNEAVVQQSIASHDWRCVVLHGCVAGTVRSVGEARRLFPEATGKTRIMGSFKQIVSRFLQPAIFPFYVLLLVYLVTYKPHVARPDECITAAILKILPIWFLVYYTYQRQETTGAPPAGRNYFLYGLMISSLGDVCLVYQNLFKPGVGVFGMAQLCYLLHFRRGCTRQTRAWIAPLLGACVYVILFPGMEETSMRLIVLLYTCLIHAMLYYAISGYESRPSPSSFCAMLGAFVFISSDFTIAFSKWVYEFSLAEGVIMATYYTAQLLLTIGNS